MKHGKAYNKASATIDKDALYSPLAAVRLAKAGATSSKFDQTVEVAMLLGVDPRKADQMVDRKSTRLNSSH